jgi:hypothetical protein
MSARRRDLMVGEVGALAWSRPEWEQWLDPVRRVGVLMFLDETDSQAPSPRHTGSALVNRERCL